MEANNFRDWQADYAAHGIPTVPVEFIREGDGIRKKPMVGNAGRFGLVGSSKIASKFATAPGIGFMWADPAALPCSIGIPRTSEDSPRRWTATEPHHSLRGRRLEAPRILPAQRGAPMDQATARCANRYFGRRAQCCSAVAD